MPDLVDRHDAGMLELGGAPGLAQEAVQVLGPGEAAAAGDLEGDDAVELGVAGLVDGAEGADAELLEQLELAEALGGFARAANRRWRRGRAGCWSRTTGRRLRGAACPRGQSCSGNAGTAGAWP